VSAETIINDAFSYSENNSENRNDPDLVQAFLKKWWVESDFKAPNLPLSLRLKGSGCHYISIYNNTGTKSAFEIHNYKSVQISVILSKNHLKLFYKHVH
jgi:hypothetical protein